VSTKIEHGGEQHWHPWLIRDKDGDYAWGVRVGNGTVGSGMARTPEGALRCIIQTVLSNPFRFMAPEGAESQKVEAT